MTNTLTRIADALERIATALERETPEINVGATIEDSWPRIPANIFWSEKADGFYSSAGGHEMPISFYKNWHDRRAEFPAAPYHPITEPTIIPDDK